MGAFWLFFSLIKYDLTHTPLPPPHLGKEKKNAVKCVLVIVQISLLIRFCFCVDASIVSVFAAILVVHKGP